MQRITLRWFGAMAAVLGFGGLASAQYAAPGYFPAIPQAPAVQSYQAGQQTAGFSPNAPWMKAIAQPAASPVQSEAYQLVQAQTAPTQPGAGPAIPPTTPGSFPYNQPQGKTPAVPPSITAGQAQASQAPETPLGPFGTFGAPRQPRMTAFNVGLAPVPYNEYCPQCANGCGSLKSDLGFFFGSCKSFFNPCGPIPCNGFLTNSHIGTGCSGCKKCSPPPTNRPYGHGYNTCAYDSYLNH